MSTPERITTGMKKPETGDPAAGPPENNAPDPGTPKTNGPEHLQETDDSDRIPPGFRYREVLRKGRPLHAPMDSFAVRHPPMPLSKRAKIFSPFDALRGFREAIAAQNGTCGRILEKQLESVSGNLPKVMPGSMPEDSEGSMAEFASGDISGSMLPGSWRNAFENMFEGITEECNMCTRFYIDISDKELQEIVEAAQSSALAEKFLRAGDPLTPSGEIRPTDVAPVIAMSRSGNRAVFPMKWGFRMPGLSGRNTVSTILNARSETAAQKRTFRESWQQHRCIVPASYYFEWEHLVSPEGKKKTGQKYAIQPKGSAVTWLCGLYRMEDGFPHFVVLTRPPAQDIAFIHDRMPVILPQEHIGEWIDPAADPAQTIRHALEDMIYDRAV